MNLFQVCDDRYGYNIEPFAGMGYERKCKVCLQLMRERKNARRRMREY
jgi:hypothetical protein